ncbi:MAG: tetratricopeptide repeat protein [Planctomycetota bacterium]
MQTRVGLRAWQGGFAVASVAGLALSVSVVLGGCASPSSDRRSNPEFQNQINNEPLASARERRPEPGAERAAPATPDPVELQVVSPIEDPEPEPASVAVDSEPVRTLPREPQSDPISTERMSDLEPRLIEDDASARVFEPELRTEDLMESESSETEGNDDPDPDDPPVPQPVADEPEAELIDAPVVSDEAEAETSQRAVRPREADLDAAGRGAVLAEMGQYDAALAEFIRAIEENPELISAHVGMGQILVRQGDYAGGRAAFERAVDLDPSSFPARAGLALAYLLDERPADAAREYARALQIRPDDFDANLNIASAYLSLEEPRSAVTHATAAVEAQPDNGPARITLATALDAVGRHEDAVIEYRQAAELTELTPQLLLSYAESLGKTSRFEEMVQTLDQLVRIEPSAPALERLGSALFRLKRFDEALGEFERSVEADPDHYPGWNGIAVCRLNQYLWSGRADREALRHARDAMQRSLRINRRQPRIVELLTRYR